MDSVKCDAIVCQNRKMWAVCLTLVARQTALKKLKTKFGEDVDYIG